MPKSTFRRKYSSSRCRCAVFFRSSSAYAQGLAMLHVASNELDMQIPMPEVVRVWRGGCIIRSSLLEHFMRPSRRTLQLAKSCWTPISHNCCKRSKQNMRNVIMHATQTGYPVAGLMAALSYFDAYRSEQSAHQPDPGTTGLFRRAYLPANRHAGTFHTEWQQF